MLQLVLKVAFGERLRHSLTLLSYKFFRNCIYLVVTLTESLALQAYIIKAQLLYKLYDSTIENELLRSSIFFGENLDLRVTSLILNKFTRKFRCFDFCVENVKDAPFEQNPILLSIQEYLI